MVLLWILPGTRTRGNSTSTPSWVEREPRAQIICQSCLLSVVGVRWSGSRCCNRLFLPRRASGGTKERPAKIEKFRNWAVFSNCGATVHRRGSECRIREETCMRFAEASSQILVQPAGRGAVRFFSGYEPLSEAASTAFYYFLEWQRPHKKKKKLESLCCDRFIRDILVYCVWAGRF